MIPLPLETERLVIRAFAWAAVEKEPELGYTFARAAWGNGFALEAARACVEAAFAHLPQRRVVAKVEPRNGRSIRLAQRLGMRTVETISVDGRPHPLLALERA